MKSIAVFDIDGTIVRGNSMELFLQHLFENNVIGRETAFGLYESFPFPPTELFKVFAGISLNKRKECWEHCFNTSIKPRFDKRIVEEIIRLKREDYRIVLASGTPKEFQKSFGGELEINEEDLIGPVLDYSVNESFPTKDLLFNNWLNKHQLLATDCIMYSDNLSDLDLMKRMRNAYWIGEEKFYRKHLNNTKVLHFNNRK